MDYLNQILLIRGIERILIVIFSGSSIILGWNLFKIGIITKQSGEIKTSGFFIRLTKVGPGIFFALFGCLVLVQSLYSPFTYKIPEDNNTLKEEENKNEDIVVSYFSENIHKYLILAKSINTISEQIQKTPNLNNREIVETAIKNLEDERNMWIINVYGIEGLNLWNESGYDFIVNPEHFSKDDQETLKAISEWMIGGIER